MLPLVAVLLEGWSRSWAAPRLVWAAALRSIVVALVLHGAWPSALALPIALFAARGRGWVETLAALSISVSPLVMGTGLFLILFPIADPVALALPVTAFVNALVALPFILRGLIPEVRTGGGGAGAAGRCAGPDGWARLRLAILPRLRGPWASARGWRRRFRWGTWGSSRCFRRPAQATLPMEMYRLMGSYRTEDAEGAAVLLMLLALGVFWLFDRGGAWMLALEGIELSLGAFRLAVDATIARGSVWRCWARRAAGRARLCRFWRGSWCRRPGASRGMGGHHRCAARGAAHVDPVSGREPVSASDGGAECGPGPAERPAADGG
jgi:ABC-type spermidine/putrescine transport system permease subunit II